MPSARPAIRISNRRDHHRRPRNRSDRGRGKILTAGGFDTHIHFICPQQVDDALMSG